MPAVPEKIDELIARFPWDGDGFPSKPNGLTGELPRQAVEHWLDEQTLIFKTTALALIARVQPILLRLEREATRRNGGYRFLARIDQSFLRKTPTGILEKMARGGAHTSATPPVTFENFHIALHDLGRFRIVANFLSDVHDIAGVLQQPYTNPADDLTSAQQHLRDDFVLESDQFEDSIEILPAVRKSGERCLKGTFYPQSEGQHHRIEVQIQTQLQEAWDKKDHFLIYEPRRRGQEPPAQKVCEMHAMSELLYIADRTFDRLFTELIDKDTTRENNDA